MSVRALVIPTKFTAVDNLSPTLSRMANGSEKLFNKLTPALSSASKQLLQMASGAALVAGAFQLGRSSINSIMDYETALQSLQAVTGVNDEQMGSFKSQINDLAKVSKKSAIEVAGSFETIGSAMSQYLEDPKALRQIAEAGITLSKASRTELQPTLENLTSIMNQFGLKAEQAAKSVDILTAGEIVGSIRTSQAAGYLQEFGATAKNMNVSLSESTALIEALGIQMSKDKIGVGARNILTAISAAGGLDKKARSDLKAAGVDIGFLMDNTQSLSARLHELSKIAKDPVKMVSVFGKENLTAGQVIFNQLNRYDEFAGKIQNTAKSQEQAALNSNTLANRLDELKNSWSNMLTSSDGANSGLEKVKSTIVFLTENLSEIVSVGIGVLKFFTAWKILNVALRAITFSYNVILGVRNALMLRSAILIEGNTVAMAAGVWTEKAMVAQMWLSRAATSAWSVVTAIATGDMWALNAAMAANPIGLITIGVAALAAGIGFLIFQNQALWEEYEKRSNQNIIDSMTSEERAVNSLAERYIKLGYSKEQAFLMSLKYERQENDLDIIRKKDEIAKLKIQRAEKEVMFMGGKINLPGHDAIQDKINAKEMSITGYMSKNLELTNLALGKTAFDQKHFDKFNMEDTKVTAAQALGTFESSKVAQAQNSNTISTNNNNQNVVLTLKNESNNEVDANGFGKSFNIMPGVTSTLAVKK